MRKNVFCGSLKMNLSFTLRKFSCNLQIVLVCSKTWLNDHMCKFPTNPRVSLMNNDTTLQYFCNLQSLYNAITNLITKLSNISITDLLNILSYIFYKFNRNIHSLSYIEVKNPGNSASKQSPFELTPP